MIEQQFRWLLQVGLGRAITYARDHGAAEFRHLIRQACLRCWAHDPQSEGTRAGYTLDLLEFAGGRQECIDAVLESLPGSGDDWDARQRFEFASLLAEEGDQRARQAVYDSFPSPRPRFGAAIGIEFLRFAGIDGLSYVAGVLDGWRRAGHKVVDVGYLLSVGTERFGEEATRVAMRPLADLDHERRYADDLEGRGYGELRPKLLAAHPLRLGRWALEVDETDLIQAAHGLREARDEAEVIAHLNIFAERAYPLDPQDLLSLVASGSEAIRGAALRTLAQIVHPEVRRLAFRVMESRSPWRREAIALLTKNFMPGDHQVALAWFAKEDDLDRRHDHHFRLNELWREHPDAATEPHKLLTQYELGPCSWCRENIVARMKELDLLTPALRDECAWDCNHDVRSLVA